MGTAGFEPRLDNYLANTTLPAGAVPWSNDIGQTYWTKWIAKRNQVSGNFTGTTDQIFKWAACKWGIDENVLRAVAVQESDWHQNTKGDYANGAYHSWGVMQVRNTENDGSPAWGGYPDTAGLSSGTDYSYSVAAADNTGNQSAHCQVITMTA